MTRFAWCFEFFAGLLWCLPSLVVCFVRFVLCLRVCVCVCVRVRARLSLSVWCLGWVSPTSPKETKIQKHGKHFDGEMENRAIIAWMFFIPFTIQFFMFGGSICHFSFVFLSFLFFGGELFSQFFSFRSGGVLIFSQFFSKKNL